MQWNQSGIPIYNKLTCHTVIRKNINRCNVSLQGVNLNTIFDSSVDRCLLPFPSSLLIAKAVL